MLIATSCIRSIIKLAGVTLGKRRALRRTGPRFKVVKKLRWTKATTTPLVRNLFESFFADQIETNKENVQGPRRNRCGVCDTCQKSDCGQCKHCKDMIKFGGSGRSKQCCMERRCPNMALAEAEDDDDTEDFEGFTIGEIAKPKQYRVRKHTHRISWIGDPFVVERKRTYYKSVLIEDEEYHVNDNVMVEPDDPKTPVYIARINHMWENGRGEQYFHADWYCRGSDTVLGETADPLELFITDDCEDTLLDSIIKKVCVKVYTDLCFSFLFTNHTRFRTSLHLFHIFFMTYSYTLIKIVSFAELSVLMIIA